jgi:cytochrome b
MRIYIWDLPLRLFHWLLVVTLLAAYVTGQWGGLWLDWHARLGLVALALVVFRLAWGFLGSRYARFGDFMPTPARLRAYLLARWEGIGHTPLGGLAILALLGLVLAQVGLGLFAWNEDTEFHGPLYDLVSTDMSNRLTAWHRQSVNVLLGVVGLHVLAIGYYYWFKRKNLLLPMITGTMDLPVQRDVQATRGAGTWQLLLALCLAGIVFWCIQSGSLLRWLTALTHA